MTMSELLSFLDMNGGNPNTTLDTRPKITKWIKENKPEWYNDYQFAWKMKYIRNGKLWGIVLTKRGHEHYHKLRNNTLR